MRLTQQLIRFGRQLVIAGWIAIGLGMLMLVIEGLGQAVRWSTLATIALLAACISGGIYLYQQGVYWRKLRRRLMAAQVAAETPATIVRPLPGWLWAVWVLLALSFAYSMPPFAIFFGSLLLGYGLSSPALARQVQALEAGRVEFYAVRDAKTRRPTVVRVVPDSTWNESNQD